MSAYRVSLFLAFAAVLLVPYALRPATEAPRPDALQLVIITPHVQTIWYEFEHAFSDWHEKHYGQPVAIDWRSPGGTGAITQFLNARFDAVGSVPVSRSGETGTDPVLPGIGIDILFGGGQYDHEQQKKLGHTAPTRLIQDHPELFRPDIIPQTLSGTTFYDPDGCYFGCCLSLFGIVSNTEAMMRQGVPRNRIPPRQWADLTDPAFYRKLVIADPAMSGSIVKAFEMVLQQAIHQTVAERTKAAGGTLAPAAEKQAVADGFWRGMRLIQIICANARRIARMSGESPIDVSQGEALAAMCIDYYGLVQAEIVARPDGTSRVAYVTPVGGSAVDCDPISMLRGAPHRVLAERFIYFCLTPEGQKLWCYRVGTPGGPRKYALHRPPIRRDLYTPDSRRYFADDMNPYELAEKFTYRPEWTARLFTFIRVFIRAMCMDSEVELQRAWGAILAAHQTDPASPAMMALQVMPLSWDEINDKSFQAQFKDPVRLTELTREWTAFFRSAYADAEALARKQGGAAQ